MSCHSRGPLAAVWYPPGTSPYPPHSSLVVEWAFDVMHQFFSSFSAISSRLRGYASIFSFSLPRCFAVLTSAFALERCIPLLGPSFLAPAIFVTLASPSCISSCSVAAQKAGRIVTSGVWLSHGFKKLPFHLCPFPLGVGGVCRGGF